MDILDEKDERVVRMDINLDKTEQKLLMRYFKENCTKEEHESLKMEWAFVKLLEEFVEKHEKTDKK
jgi:hypothetical protein